MDTTSYYYILILIAPKKFENKLLQGLWASCQSLFTSFRQALWKLAVTIVIVFVNELCRLSLRISRAWFSFLSGSPTQRCACFILQPFPALQWTHIYTAATHLCHSVFCHFGCSFTFFPSFPSSSLLPFLTWGGLLTTNQIEFGMFTSCSIIRG